MRSLYTSRPIDKKKIVFFTNKAAALPVDDEFHKLWRSVVVESTDNLKIEEYLEKQGIHSMEDHRPKKATLHKRQGHQSARN
ncbi:Transcription initiation factor IIE subunit beta [Periplaneta americana]|uniref:Transcription initiation factor IIE subunit beta n=1 Tax=Periplaneta americana TaxID=6978 RepID=A0ABQ8SH58_PERAM|nr:Transcription initiation factor IIE subunit beta [Periplaneta americana]